MPDESWRIQWSKHCDDDNKKDEDSGLHINKTNCNNQLIIM